MNKHRYTYPWRSHNAFQLLIDGSEFYPEMLHAIDTAQHFILLEQYLVNSGHILKDFIATLSRASQRGVQIYIIFDDYGAKSISPEDLNKLAHEPIHVCFYNPFRWRSLYRSMRRNHRKLLIIDNRIAFVGGAGITDEYLTSPIKTDAKMNWHDIMLRVEGEVVLDWINSFCQVWQSISPQQVHIKDEKQDVTQFKQHGRVLLAQGPGHNQIIKSAIRNINRSQARVWIATPYFITTRKLRHALSRAAKRGVDVRLLLPGPISDHPWISQAARRYYKRLLHNGVKIFEYLPRFLHAKLILADDWISIGSSNLDRWNQFWNLDANQAINDHILLRQCESMFEVDFRQSQELRYAQWRKRPWSQRIAEWWSSYIVRTIHWVVYISARMRNKHTP